MSEYLRTTKIPCYERVRDYRVHKIGVFSEKIPCPNIYGVRIFKVNTVILLFVKRTNWCLHKKKILSFMK